MDVLLSVLLSTLLLIGSIWLISAVLLFSFWALSVLRRLVLKTPTIGYAFVTAAFLLAAFPETDLAGLVMFGIALTGVACEYVSRLWNRHGAADTRLQMLLEFWGLAFLLALACKAFSLPIAVALALAVPGWLLSNEIAKRREWPMLMRRATR